MARRWSCVFVFLVGGIFLEPTLSAAKGQSTFSLSQYKGKRSLLIFFAKEKSDPIVHKQIEVLKDLHKELKKSNIELIYSFESDSPGRWGTTHLRAVESQDLRRSLKVEPNDFLLILINKEGAIKKRSTQALSKEALLPWIK